MLSTFLVLALAATTSAVAFAADSAFKRERHSPDQYSSGAPPPVYFAQEPAGGRRRDDTHCRDASKPKKGEPEGQMQVDVACICCEKDCNNVHLQAQDLNDVAFRNCFHTECAPGRCYRLNPWPPQ